MKYTEKDSDGFFTWELKNYGGANNFSICFWVIIELILLIIIIFMVFIEIF